MDELEDFDEIEEAGLSNDKIEISNIYSVKVGGFGKENEVETYITSARVQQLKQDISFYETLSKDKTWPVSQIVQREVDKIRVSEISKNYILGKGRKVKYFPPIIVALMPKTSEGKFSEHLDLNPDNSQKLKELIYNKSVFNSNSKIEKYIVGSENLSKVNHVYLLEISKVFDMKLFAWNRERVFAIVIDGQHRLDSLYKSADEESSILEYEQDVVFLDFSKLAIRESLTPVDIVRRIFVDINTNAKKVSFVRQILMDDKDLSALIVQSMVDSANHIGEMKAKFDYLKPEIVDWYGEGLKPRLPHLTGILSLYQIIDDYFIKVSLSRMGDFRSLSKARNWVNRLNTLFNIDIILDNEYPEIERLGEALKLYEKSIKNNREYEVDIDDEFKESELFRFDYRILEIVQKQFEDKYLRSIVSFFERLVPYNYVILEINNETSESNLSFALTLSRKKLGEKRDMRDLVEKFRKALESKFFPKFYLIYTVLAQKSIFLLLFKRILNKLSPSPTFFEIEKSSNELIEELNNLFTSIEKKEISLFQKKDGINIACEESPYVDFGSIYNSFYDGMIYEGNSIIYNTQGVRSFSSFIEYLIEINEGRVLKNDISLATIPYFKVRTKRILEKGFNHLPPDALDDIANGIIAEKSSFLADYMLSVKE
ncbi:ParB N-terminal domain-containing protein [Lunatibacter salilacus]|uniref:DNA sulfur modification protein DndB n=1 Tax=Lunatibacter salilacus TaxID=2483804 RepID=UPI00131CD9D1|nr:DNA sulfur modification protein DndB [Lunatibacter salilacus]